MPRILILLGILAASLALLPLGWLALNATTDAPVPRLQVVPDMDAQPKARTQSTSGFFADGRSARPPVDGTVARDESPVLDVRETGREGEGFVATIPLPLDRALLDRGRDRFDVFCAPCHGLAGRGDGLVARRAAERGEAAWVAPSDLTADAVAAKPAGELYVAIREGIRNMPAYAAQIPTGDRWAIVAYLRALQRSANGSVADLTDEQRAALEGGR